VFGCAQLVDTRDHSSLTPGTRDHIRVKNAISIEMRGLMGELDSLVKLNAAEVERAKGKMSLEEIKARKDIIESLSTGEAGVRAQCTHPRAGQRS
jgi:hypothetical protein